MNVTKQTQDAIQEMVHESFFVNSTIDRMKSVLGTKLAYNNTANLIHLNIAHAYPTTFGDALGDLGLEGYNIPVVYGDIPLMNKDYTSALEILSDLQSLTLDYQNKLNMCAKIAYDNMDLHVFADLLGIITKHNEIVRQCILLVDKARLYNGNPSFDTDISTFWILGGA